ncbi:ABC transporter substrate-binding protein [Bifidobacterium myosotis]|uniref:ABC transporter substrate-binding protein n=1 Tax=Bifidobacterium myosotis TaxID=1630166 RepID=A0A261FMI3_9BIFI|nr:extracellular solute-binding protein [Bifidobacterium myosotis]OZG60381.1 ABC transporter substrate-binding protein [Bifidobacterium myosotis]
MELKKKITSVLAVGLAAAMTFSLAACGSDTAGEEKDDGSLVTVDVFDSLANQQGEQKGWFAKIVQDKFNLKLNIIAPNVSGGDTVFDTRAASGSLGDLIITGTGNGRLQKLVKANLVTDMTPYYSSMTNVKKYQNAVDAITEQAGKDGVWGIPQGVSSSDPSSPSEGMEPTSAPYIRWEYYKELGYPEIKDLDAFLDVLKDMQDLARKETGQNDIYAFSLFKDWDGDVMNNASAVVNWLGYQGQGSVFISADGKDVQPATQEGGVYEQALEFLNKAEQMGLVDPESTTQDWDTMQNKVTNGKTLVSLFSWLGKPRMNSDENKAKGVGFMLAPLQSMKVYSTGFTPDGDGSTIIAIGSKSKYKERLAKFIDWLYSSEGVYAAASNSGGAACPKGLGCWTEGSDGKPQLTDFGKQAMNGDHANLKISDDLGGGTYDSGFSLLNFKAVQQNDIDSETGAAFNPQLWESEADTSALFKDWSEHMGGATSDIDYLEKNNLLTVAPGASYTTPQEESTVSATRSSIKTEVVNASWNALVAKSDAEFAKVLKDVRQQVKDLGYDSVLKVDEQNAKDLAKARQEVVKQYQSDAK